MSERGRPIIDSPAARRVSELMKRLDSLVDGEDAAAHLVACGPAAVEPLRRFVLESPPRSVPQPRCWAVRALGGLGQKEILIEYLRRAVVGDDPVVRLAEEAVQREAALALAAWQTDDVFEILLRLTSRKLIPGVIEAIGRFRRREAVPVLMRALGDDFASSWAEEALMPIAGRDRDRLIQCALTPEPDRASESARSVQRRRAVLRLLRDVPLTCQEAHGLTTLLTHNDIEIAVEAAAIAVKSGTPTDGRSAQVRLRELLAEAPWHLHHYMKSLLERPLPHEGT